MLQETSTEDNIYIRYANAQAVIDRTSGALVEYILRGECLRLKKDEIFVTLEGERISLFSLAAQCIRQEDTAEWIYHAGGCKVVLRYQFSACAAFKRSIHVYAQKDQLCFDEVHFCSALAQPPQEIVPYHVFWNAPLCLFARDAEYGWLTGIENPFFEMNACTETIDLSFQPGLVMQIDEVCHCEPQFFMLYQLTHQRVSDHADRFAFLPSKEEGQDRCRFRNPDGHIPLDIAEISAMRTYIEEYLETPLREFITILYMYWFPIRQMPNSDEDEEAYRRVLHTFKQLGGEMVVFNPLFPYDLPGSTESAYWELAPEGSSAARILAYARSLGLKYGFYMGVAAHGSSGDGAALPFRPEVDSCKKRWQDGQLSDENCLASEEHLSWWLRVHTNTIDRYQLNYWSWDPGPGNGMHCFADNHGHKPGKGAYRGFQNSQKMLHMLRERYPDLYLMSFYGRKEYGPWGFKYFDQQESYWEQSPCICATLHPDLHDDRMNAHGVRMQSAWNQLFRFLPPRMNHVLVHRICENSFSSALPQLWDMDGWQFAVLSGIAWAGSMTLDLLPADENVVEQMVPFYQHWIAWAKENIGSINSLIPLGGYAEAGRYDGAARIQGDRGHIFLFNASPLRLRDQIQLDEKIGFTGEACSIRMLYPLDGAMQYNVARQSGFFLQGDKLDFCLEPYGVIILQLLPGKEQLLYGLPGEGVLEESGRLKWTAPALPAGVFYSVHTASQVKSLWVNGQPIPRDHGVCTGEQGLIERSLTQFITMDGKPYPVLTNSEECKIQLQTNFTLEEGLARHVACLSGRDSHDMLAQAARWREKLDNADFHNYLWAEKGRALVVIYTRTCVGIEAVRLWLDGKTIETEAFLLNGKPMFFYAHLSPENLVAGGHELCVELSGLQAGQFLGAWLEFAPYETSALFRPAKEPNYLPCSMQKMEKEDIRSPLCLYDVHISSEVISADGDEVIVSARLEGGEGQSAVLYVENATLPMTTRLVYNERENRFFATVPTGCRSSNIIDAECFHVFGIDEEGRRIAPVRLPFTFQADRHAVSETQIH